MEKTEQFEEYENLNVIQNKTGRNWCIKTYDEHNGPAAAHSRAEYIIRDPIVCIMCGDLATGRTPETISIADRPSYSDSLPKGCCSARA